MMKKLLSLALSLLIVSNVAADAVLMETEQEEVTKEAAAYVLRLQEAGLKNEEIATRLMNEVDAQQGGTTLSLRNSEKVTYFVLGAAAVLATYGAYFGVSKLITWMKNRKTGTAGAEKTAGSTTTGTVGAEKAAEATTTGTAGAEKAAEAATAGTATTEVAGSTTTGTVEAATAEVAGSEKASV